MVSMRAGRFFVARGCSEVDRTHLMVAAGCSDFVSSDVGVFLAFGGPDIVIKSLSVVNININLS